jgi:glycosidase
METRANYLNKLLEDLNNCDYSFPDYWIPKIWINPEEAGEIFRIEPKQFFIEQIEKILSFGENTETASTPKNPLVYCMMIRYTTAFDHNQDGKLNFEPIDNLFYETGTFLKTIALLPYLKHLGIDILYLLPINEICMQGLKGNLGSPYAYKHPLRLDPRLGEPFLTLSLDEQFSALVEACHLLGIKVVLEFVLRTSGICTDLALEHPDWFYWVKASCIENGEFAPPKFTQKELEIISEKVLNNDFENLIPPDSNYQKLFTPTLEFVHLENGIPIGILSDGTKARIPFAFADWPPDDTQPLWKDVTYFRYYEHPDFNYIAYNTVRMYSKELIEGGRKVESLWNFIADIIPYFITKFNIDGAMIDMGHAIPQELLDNIFANARSLKEDFIFWEENFNIHSKSKEQGYNATLGYLFFDEANPEKMNEFIMKLENDEFPLPFFLTPETHNTPRSARFGCNYSKMTYVFNSFLPGIRFLLSGFELCDALPYNTGLNFTPEEIEQYPPEILPLFSIASMPWLNSNIVRFIQNVNSLVKEFNLTNEKFEESKIVKLDSTNPYVVAYKRVLKEFDIIILGNFSNQEQPTFIESDNSFLKYSEIILGEFCMNSYNQIILLPFGYAVFKYFKQL